MNNEISQTGTLSYGASRSSKGKKPINKEIFILIGVQLLMLGALFSVTYFRDYFEEFHLQRLETPLGKVTSLIVVGLLVFQALFLLYILYNYFRYKAIPSVSDEELPTTTVIVPAYNEGNLVYHTLKSIVSSDYPSEKLEIIAIDDGSTDDTWHWIQQAEKELQGRVQILQQPVNRGKRQALYRGFNIGKGEIFVTIDSDSVVEKNTLRNLVSPFVVNPKCGAVAGNVKVLNKKQGIIPKMLNVSFVFSFEFMRAAQSSLGFVLCTPGALSAYRKEAALAALPKWIDQKFLGETATIGEDRAMTNFILEQGYEVKFQRNAPVLTNTPVGYKNLHKMFTRWGRSNVRETWMMNKFIFQNFREGSKAGPRIIYANQWMRILFAIPLTLVMLYLVFTHPLIFLGSALVGTFIFSSIQMLFYSRRYSFKDALWAYPYSVFYLFGLFWISPFAIATVKNGGWLTR